MGVDNILKRKNNKKKPPFHEEKAIKRLTTSKQYDTINLPQFINTKEKRGDFSMSFFDYNTILSEKSQAKINRLISRVNYKDYLIYPVTEILKETTWKAEESDKIKRFKDCGKFITIDPETGNILKANFCKQRLCPVCNYIKSCVNWHKIRNCVEWIKEKEPGANFIFMTLTVKNCKQEDLTDTINTLVEGFRRLTNRRTWKATVTGAIRGLEVTYNEEKNTFHPHIHILVSVPEDYFAQGSKKYITIERLRKWWTESARLNYFVQVDIKAIDQTENAIAEVAKYSIKMADILKADCCEEMIRATKTAYQCTYGRRLIATLGYFKEAMKELKQGDLDEFELSQEFTHENKIEMVWNNTEDTYELRRI